MELCVAIRTYDPSISLLSHIFANEVSKVLDVGAKTSGR